MQGEYHVQGTSCKVLPGLRDFTCSCAICMTMIHNNRDSPCYPVYCVPVCGIHTACLACYLLLRQPPLPVLLLGLLLHILKGLRKQAGAPHTDGVQVWTPQALVRGVLLTCAFTLYTMLTVSLLAVSCCSLGSGPGGGHTPTCASPCTPRKTQ
jgi:hypothetical protein